MDGYYASNMCSCVCVLVWSLPMLVPRVDLQQLCTTNAGKWISMHILVLSSDKKNEKILAQVSLSLPPLSQTHTQTCTDFTSTEV